MACFGFFHVSSEYLPSEKDLVKTSSMKKKKKKNPWICWPRFRAKKSAAKTVPVDNSMDPAANIHLTKPDHKKLRSSNKLTQSIGVNADVKPYKRRLGTVKEITVIHEKNHSISPARANEEKKPSDRKKDTNKTGLSPPENKHVSSRTTTTATSKTNVDVNKRGLDSIVGMSVIIVILVLILFCGKLCAILCTSAWLYMIPMLRTTVDSNVLVENGPDSDTRLPDLDSEEYKKKVVLEGLLQRSRRTIIGIL